MINVRKLISMNKIPMMETLTLEYKPDVEVYRNKVVWKGSCEGSRA